jgi:hypothetical protein
LRRFLGAGARLVPHQAGRCEHARRWDAGRGP